MQSSPQLPWRSLLIAVALVPLAVGVIPFAGTPVTLNSFVQAKVIVLALGMAVTLGLWAVGRHWPRSSCWRAPPPSSA